MPEDQNEPRNPIPEENPSPASSQGATEPTPENTAHSEPFEAPPEALESSQNDFPVKSNNIPPSDSTHIEPEKEPKNQAENEPVPEPISEPNQAPKPQTAQIQVSEPLPESEPSVSEAKEEAKPELESEKEKPGDSYLKSRKAKELLALARNAIQFRKRKKLNRVMSLFENKNGSTSSPQVTNDEVEKFLHVSDATATRYLSILEKEGRIKQNGKTGHMVSYSKI